MGAQQFFFHVDLDAFFASVEQLDNPEWRGKPVIVGGDPGKRGVVSTCSYEARKFGVRSAMPMARAVSLCPHAIFVRGNMNRYGEKSAEVMRVFGEFSPCVQQISIDEAFIDMTGTERLFGLPGESAKRLKCRVRESTGLTVSVGVAPNRYIAKIASGLSKPDGLVIVKKGEEASFMASLRLKDVWGVGEKTRERLEAAGLGTIEAILGCSITLLKSLLGESGGAYLHSVVRGIDPGICSAESATRSLSSERTFQEDLLDRTILGTALLDLSSDVMYRMLDEGLSGRTVHLKIRYADFRTVSAQETYEASISDAGDLFEKAYSLLEKKLERGNPVRLVGVGVFNVTDKFCPEQKDLFENGTGNKQRKVEQTIHTLAKKRGTRMVTRARLISGPDGDR